MTDQTRHNSDDLLLAVEKPSRYSGGEVNSMREPDTATRLHFALAFPDVYEVGMSHLGIQIIYSILNAMKDVSCERCYAPWPDMETEMRRRRVSLCSLESRRPLAAFDIVGFSLQYELSYTNVLMMLELGRIPLHREQRDESHPLIIAGGPSSFNPAPMSAFIDAFVIGEGEEAVTEIAAAVMAVRTRSGKRHTQLEALAGISGVYVPLIHSGKERIRKRIITDLNAWQFPRCPIVPLMKTIHDRVTLEIARGCTRGCRFCQAGMVWRPVRERTPAVVEEMADAMLRATGHDELSLLSLSSGDYTLIEPLIKSLMDCYYERRVAIALPSLRVETLTPKLIEAIRRVRKTSFTLAPEAGTQRLRNAINKGNSEEELLATTGRVFSAGWKAVKLYFMLGLPSESEEDLQGIVDLAYKALGTAQNRGQVTISLSTFVPKPHTPFQWQRQIGIEETAARQDFFRRRLKNRNIGVKWHDARMSLLEGILSRGGAECGALIETAFRLGCRFDGWSDRLRYDLWEEALRLTGINSNDYLRGRPLTEDFPWGKIDCGLRQEFLLAEALKAETGETTVDCRTDSCSNCGVCDHRVIRVVTAPGDSPVGRLSTTRTRRKEGERTEKAFRLCFTKLGPARFLSHLEISSALCRAMIIGGISFVYSQGFHPHPKISFAGATSVGMESVGELMDIRIEDPGEDLSVLADRINAALPAGVMIKAMHELSPNASSLAEMVVGFEYSLILPDDLGDAELDQIEAKIRRFCDAASFKVSRRVKGNTVLKEVRPFAQCIALDRCSRRILLRTHFGPEGTLRPAELLTAILGLSDQTLYQTQVLRTGTRVVDPAGSLDREIFFDCPS